MPIARIAGQAGGNFADNTTSVSKAYAGNVTSGNLLIIGGVKYTTVTDPFIAGDLTKTAGTATIGTIALDVENSFTDTFSNVYSVGIWSVPVTGTGSCTLRIAGAGAGSYLLIGIEEISGADVSGTRLEATNKNQANTGAPDSGNATSAAGALFFSSLGTDVSSSTTHTVDGAFTLIYEQEDGANHQTGAFGDQIVTTGTTDSGSWSAPTTIPWDCVVAIYKAAAGAAAATFRRTQSDRIGSRS